MDFIDCLKDSINKIPNLPVSLKKGYLLEDESLVLYPLPGGIDLHVYYDGSKVQQLNYGIDMKSRDGNKVEQVLEFITNYLDGEEINVISRDGSFEFNSINISNKPFIDDAYEQGWLVFRLTIQAKITIN
ncbi:phage tail terminator protein [Enterococcus sp. AZ163]|uniref:phage tail terminator protein n=1 Tax=Enterococcus sp. AZ163 TaxID=2774638 RepID=UPI003D2932F9